MSSVIKRAAAKQRAAMYRLLDQYKRPIYTLAWRLLDDEDVAAEVTIAAFRATWEMISPTMSEAAFERQLTLNAVNLCKTEILRKNAKAMRIPQDRRFVLSPTAEIVADGDSPLAVIKANFSPMQWMIFVLHTGSSLSREDQAAVLKLDRRTLDAAWEAEDKNIPTILSRTSFGTVSDVTAQMTADARHVDIPPSVKNKSEAHIRALAAPHEKAARLKTLKLTAIVVVIVVVVLGLCVAAVLSLSGVEEDPLDNSGQSSSSDSFAPGTITSLTSPTHYAEIVVKDHGTITVALDANIAPTTVANFKKLADDHFYDGLTFHRIMKGFMMQGGDPKGDGTGGSDEDIVGEFRSNGFDNQISHVRGAISMARANDYNSGSSQFFIVHEDSTFLDGDYAGFGFVVDGMSIVDTVCTSAQPLDDNGTIEVGEQPVIETIKVYAAEDYTPAA